MFTFCLFMVWLHTVKDLMQGKLFQKCTHILYCSVLSLGGNVNTRWMSKPEMGSIFHINNQWNILVYRKLFCELSKLSKFNAFNLLGYQTNTWGIYSCLQIPPRENWFQYVRRVYANAINFHCITFLPNMMSLIIKASDVILGIYLSILGYDIFRSFSASRVAILIIQPCFHEVPPIFGEVSSRILFVYLFFLFLNLKKGYLDMNILFQ